MKFGKFIEITVDKLGEMFLDVEHPKKNNF